MVTVLRESGLRFVIHLDDHVPAHVHVLGDGTAKIAIADEAGDPKLIRNQGLKAGDLRKAMQIVADHRELLMERWNELHG